MNHMESYWDMLGANSGHTAMGVVLDGTMPFVTRKAAASKLSQYPIQAVSDVLFSIAMNDRESGALREEAAASLGTIWAEMGVDEARLGQLPEELQLEIRSSMPQG